MDRADLLAARGFGCPDVLRRDLWDHPDVDWWYKKNMPLLIDPTRAPAALRASPGLPAPPRRRLTTSCGSAALELVGLFGSRTRRHLSGFVHPDLSSARGRAHGTAVVYEDDGPRSRLREYDRTTGEPVGA